MRATLLEKIGGPLTLRDIEKPNANKDQLLIRVIACALCRTDLHIIDGELAAPKLPLILGHQIVGVVEQVGEEVTKFKLGDLVGVPWLGWSCGNCSYCQNKQENLCDLAQFTGFHLKGGFAEFTSAYADWCFKIPTEYSAVEAAPLLCAGLIGFRAYQKVRSSQKIGFYGFGASAHLLSQIARHEGKEIYAFTKPGDHLGQEFAKKMGAHWTGGSDTLPPTFLDAAIIFAPVGALIPQALRSIKKGGIVVSAGIHMSNIPEFPYQLLWEERIVTSIANLTRQDGHDFLKLAPEIPVRAEITTYPLEKINQAITDLRKGHLKGSAVILL